MRWWASTLRGRVLIAKTILLPLLCHAGSVIYFTDAKVVRIDPVIRIFIKVAMSTALSSKAVAGQFEKSWYPVPTSYGGLSFP